MYIQHHGAVNGVTGSCHQLHIDKHNSILIDCGLFQGAERVKINESDNIDEHLAIEFDISTVQALIVTHCHIDHVGRIPYLLAAGFRGPIYATQATAALLPLVIEDALKVGVTRNKTMIAAAIKLLKRQLVPLEYKQRQPLKLNLVNQKHSTEAKIKFQMAGHILGSAYIEVELAELKDSLANKISNKHRVVFSGDLGAPYAPLLPAPKSPYRADTLIIESTYGDKNHQDRKNRTKQLKEIIETAVDDNGIVLIPAFSIGRTQELLYELEKIIFQNKNTHIKGSQNKNNKQKQSAIWDSIDIIVDSPMAAKFTEQYKNFKSLWDKEAKRELKSGRHPLSFEQLYTVDSHQEHLNTIEYLVKSRSYSTVKPAIVIAASGMCSGGRIVNYLKQFLTDNTADVLFVGYQAQGTLGRSIQKYGAKSNEPGYVFIDGKRITIKARVHTISGYLAHADQNGLINFVKRMRHQPKHIKIVHGDESAKQALAEKYQQMLPSTKIEIPQ